jgi:hypothetical protein
MNEPQPQHHSGLFSERAGQMAKATLRRVEEQKQTVEWPKELPAETKAEPNDEESDALSADQTTES